MDVDSNCDEAEKEPTKADDIMAVTPTSQLFTAEVKKRLPGTALKVPVLKPCSINGTGV